ncbi:uncharacterized protein [Nicotiana sylvestris]|uniref:uncharacterized protein n=1 Tax=Nicotiana sylvestris TaxID=4096 RepID=UPI00388C5F46
MAKRDEIESKQGYLTKLFSEKGKQAYMKNRQEPPKPPSPKRTVNVISGSEDINDSFMNIILLRVLREMQAKDKLISKAHTLSGFDNSSVVTKGEVILTTFAKGVVKDTKFQLVDMEMAYNMILGRPWIHEMDAVPSILHQVIKFPSPWGICQIRGDQHTSRNINSVADSRYNQIKMDPMDEEKSSFITDRGTSCYKVMPFRLKNVGATYQRLILQKFNMKLNPEKCAFGVALVAETWYPQLENLALALIMASRNLRFYFQCHPIAVVTAYPLRNILHNHELSGLELARELSINQIVIKSDSQLVVNQMLGTYTARETRMQQYLEKVWDLIRQFQTLKVMQISRDENVEADALANLASAVDVASNENASVIHLFHSVLDPDKNEVNFNNLTWEWRNEIVAFLQYGTVPEDKKKAHVLQKKASRYCLKQGNLYRKMFGGPLARCLGPSQTEYIMREIHEGYCGNHAEGRSLVRTMIRVGYYWPKMKEEAEHFVAKGDKCQRYGNNMHRLAELLHPVIALWPFMKWGMDIVGPLPQAKGQVKFLLVLTDYFTKWVEAGAFKQVREKEVRDFIWRNIICRFGVPKEIVCDNDPQFIGAQITEFFQSWQIKRVTSTPYHLVGNRQAESTNKVIINNLKKRLEESKGENLDDEIMNSLYPSETIFENEDEDET